MRERKKERERETLVLWGWGCVRLIYREGKFGEYILVCLQLSAWRFYAINIFVDTRVGSSQDSSFWNGHFYN